MRAALAAALVFAAAAAVGHVLVLHALPARIMARALQTLEARGAATNAFNLAPRMTPRTQTVVRPSPDLAYSLCIFDVSEGPVLVSGVPWSDYASLSVYDARTNNVGTLSLTAGEPGPRAVAIALKGSPEGDAGGARLLVDRPRGVALVRRLAPTPEAYAAAAAVAEGDVCRPLTP